MRQQDNFFDEGGSELRAANLEELYQKVQELQVVSAHDVDHSNTSHRELFSFALYLVKVAQYHYLSFPLTIKKGESPDFVLTMADRTIGVEHRDIGSQRAHRSTAAGWTKEPRMMLVRYRTVPSAPFGLHTAPGIYFKHQFAKKRKGKNTERRWVNEAFVGIMKKLRLLNQEHFTIYEENVLLLFDNTLLWVKHPKRTLRTLRLHLQSSYEYRKFEHRFDRVILATHDNVYYDILGDMVCLPVRPPGSCSID